MTQLLFIEKTAGFRDVHWEIFFLNKDVFVFLGEKFPEYTVTSVLKYSRDKCLQCKGNYAREF